MKAICYNNLIVLFSGIQLVHAATNITFPENSVPPAGYTSSRLLHLWGDIPNVQTAAIENVVEPTPLTSAELQCPAKTLPKLTYTDEGEEHETEWQLPKHFMWGWATSAYQVEGAAKSDDRGPTVLDAYFHRQRSENLPYNTGDIAANHYYLYKQDAMRIHDFGIPAYALSVSWSRIFPFGRGEPNQAGLQHYIDEVNYLLSQGIQPVVTLNHFDLPWALEKKYGGWSNRKVVHDFVSYAETMFNALGNKVHTWITINEPTLYCETLGSCQDDPTQVLRCVHNSLLAHGLAVEKFRAMFNDGRISLKHGWGYPEPYSNSPQDQYAAKRYVDFTAGWLNEPLFGSENETCEYPQEMVRTLGDKLPAFSKREQNLVRGSADFYAWNSQPGLVVRAPYDMDNCIQNPHHELWPLCVKTGDRTENGTQLGLPGAVYPYKNTPLQFRRGLNWVSEKYRPKELIVTELGFCAPGENDLTPAQALTDDTRVDFYLQHLDVIMRAVKQDKINITGAFADSALDSFEGVRGIGARFGLQYVNFNTQKRYFKNSAFFFRDFFQSLVAEK